MCKPRSSKPSDGLQVRTSRPTGGLPVRSSRPTDGLHCKACDCQLAETSFDRELCNKCIEVVWELITDIDPEDDIVTVEPFDEEEHF